MKSHVISLIVGPPTIGQNRQAGQCETRGEKEGDGGGEGGRRSVSIG